MPKLPPEDYTVRKLGDNHGLYFRGALVESGVFANRETAMKHKRLAEHERRLSHNKPLAVPGLSSYRYKGPYGWIMIGARDDEDALREAGRSTAAPVPENLQAWNGSEYVPLDHGKEGANAQTP